MRRRLLSKVSVRLFFCYIFLSCLPESILTATVTLKSVEIFKTHEWLPVEAKVYFNCKGENKTFLPDVKKENVLYTFKDQESWQPLTEFPNKKCKRCGVYEKGRLRSDHVFGEWEFCPDDFAAPDGKYMYSVEKEFNATFYCRECIPIKVDSKPSSSSSDNNDKQNSGGQGMHWSMVVLISALVSVVLIIGLAVGYKFWQKKKREHEQARFLKLFEDGDDIEDELGIGPMGGSV